jgi:hypothetical protein
MQPNTWLWPKSDYTVTNTAAENTVEYQQVPVTKQKLITLKDPGWIIAVLIGGLLFLPLLWAAFM